MSRRKRKWKPMYLVLSVLLGIAASFVLLKQIKPPQPASTTMGSQTGYKAEDRQRLEQRIHEDTKND
ncbi:MAG: hypothetical protein HY052_09545 [Proteobacteria bacterium]|nr:hypothetical protein [Pseudomonadota bacterium]